MKEESILLTCDELREKFETIPEENNFGRLDLEMDPNIRAHIRGCSGCKEWLKEHLKQFVK